MSSTPHQHSIEAFLEEQFDQLYERIRLLDERLKSVEHQPSRAAPHSIAATSTPKPSRREKKKASPSAPATTGSIPVSPPTSGTFPQKDKPDQQLLTVIVPDALAAHLVGRDGRGLKQIHDISGAHVRAFEVKDGSAGARHVSIRGSDSQVGEALVVLGKRLARKEISVPTAGQIPPAPRPAQSPSIPQSTALPLAPSATPNPNASPTPSVPSIVMQTAAPPSQVATPGARSASTTPRTQPNTPMVPTVTMQTANPTPASSSTGTLAPGSPMNIDALRTNLAVKSASLGPLASVPHSASSSRGRGRRVFMGG